MFALPPGYRRVLWLILAGSFLLAIGLLVVTPYVADFPTSEELVVRLARAHGVHELPDDAVIEFSFRMEQKNLQEQRRWRWDRGSDTIELLSVSGQAGPPPADNPAAVRRLFEHDLVWACPPLLAVHRDDVRLVQRGMREAPIGDGELRKIAMLFTDDDAPLAGTVYELFVDQNDVIQQWIVRQGRGGKGMMVCRWIDYETVGPLRVAARRVWEDASFEATVALEILPAGEPTP
jgi:hypothetical protein